MSNKYFVAYTKTAELERSLPLFHGLRPTIDQIITEDDFLSEITKSTLTEGGW